MRERESDRKRDVTYHARLHDSVHIHHSYMCGMRLKMKLELNICQPIDQNSSVLYILALLVEYTMLVLMFHHVLEHVLRVESWNQTFLSGMLNQFPVVVVVVCVRMSE